jgi:hypothetical protein
LRGFSPSGTDLERLIIRRPHRSTGIETISFLKVERSVLLMNL